MEKYADGCNNGTLDADNTLTLCNCRDEDGRILDEYGWHCDQPNSELCDNRIGLGYTRLMQYLTFSRLLSLYKAALRRQNITSHLKLWKLVIQYVSITVQTLVLTVMAFVTSLATTI